jgi:hypothetical protein
LAHTHHDYFPKKLKDVNPIADTGTNGVPVPEIFTEISVANDVENVNDSLLLTGPNVEYYKLYEVFYISL